MDALPQREFRAVIIGGTALAMNAGYINAVSLSGLFSATVSHVTGNLTRIAVDVFLGKWLGTAILLTIVLCYMFGSFISGYMISGSRFSLGRAYGYVLLLEAACIMASFLLLRRENIIGEMFAAIACGLQNAMCTTYSGAVVRTTHMTGITTDIGMIFGQWASGKKTDIWKLKVFIPLWTGYMLGAFIGAACWVVLHHASMILPALWITAVAVAYFTWGPAKQAGKIIQTAIIQVESELAAIGKRLMFINILKAQAQDSTNLNDESFMRVVNDPRFGVVRDSEALDKEINVLMNELEARKSPASPTLERNSDLFSGSPPKKSVEELRDRRLPAALVEKSVDLECEDLDIEERRTDMKILNTI